VTRALAEVKECPRESVIRAVAQATDSSGVKTCGLQVYNVSLCCLLERLAVIVSRIEPWILIRGS